MRIFFSAALALTFVFATGCGKSSKTTAADNSRGGNCGVDVVSDYNTVMIRCAYLNTKSDASECKSTANSFLQKYPNINCLAEKSSSTSVSNVKTTVTGTEIKSIVDKITAAGF